MSLRRRTLGSTLPMALRQAMKARSRSTRLTRFLSSVFLMQRLGAMCRVFFVLYFAMLLVFLFVAHRIPHARHLDYYPAFNARFRYLQAIPPGLLARVTNSDFDDLRLAARGVQRTLVDSVSVSAADMQASRMRRPYVNADDFWSTILTTTRTTDSPTATATATATTTAKELNMPRTRASKLHGGSDTRYPPIIMGFSIHGGVGNQIYDMLEALYLVRQAGTVMLLPAVLPRTDIDGEATPPPKRVGTRLWDLRALANGTHGRPVYPYLPAGCHNRIHIVYLFMRRNGRPPRTLGVPKKVRKAVCRLALAAPRAPATCADLFAGTEVRVRRQNLTNGGDRTFIRELAALRGAAHAGRAEGGQLCVWVAGHTYDRGGAEGDEYLYAHMHFLAAHPRIAGAARRWPLSRMAVVHIRYDEELCDRDRPAHVCVRARKDGRLGVKQVYWAPVPEYVAAVCESVLRDGATALYIAASPYVPTDTLRTLRAEFAARLPLQRPASRVFRNEADINFLERELAIRSRVFVGDFGSTWSGTVYFKRRTLGLTSLWTNVLLGRASNLGYYAHNTPLEIPD